MNRPALPRFSAAQPPAGVFRCPPDAVQAISRLVVVLAALMSANACTNGSPVDTAVAAATAEAEGGRDVADARKRAAGISTAARLKAARLQRESASKAAGVARNEAIANARAVYGSAVVQCDALGSGGRDACRRQASDDYARAKANADAVRAVNDPTA